MNATDELRRLLDERGVEWMPTAWNPQRETFYRAANGVGFCADEHTDGVRIHTDATITPEHAIAATLSSDATDVLRAIDQLRRDLSGYHGQLKAHNDLQKHCDNQRKRIAELEGLYAKAKAENAKLRERIHELEMEGSDHFYRTAYAEDANRTLEADNAKLRELVDFMTSIAWYGASERERDRMRELGVDA